MDLCERIGVDDYAAGRIVTRIVHGPLMASAALETRFMTLLESWTGGAFDVLQAGIHKGLEVHSGVIIQECPELRSL